MTEIKNITVLGAGNLGAQIAMVAAYNGKNVVSYDINEEALQAARGRFEAIAANYRRDFPDATEEKIEAAFARVSQSSDLAAAVAAADLVIEAVPEDLDLKTKVYTEMAPHLPAHTILATNTSTLLPSSFAAVTGRPEKFLAMHFANNIHVINIVEVMPHAGTDAEVLNKAVAVAPEIGMRPIKLLKEQPGYIINSLMVPWINAAANLWVRGIADVPTIDATATGITRSEGFSPFRIYDTVGFGVAAHVAASRVNDPASQEFARRLKELIGEGYLGKETGKGFYTYDESGNPTGYSDVVTRDYPVID